MTQKIQPRTLSGFRDFLPEMMMPREKLIEITKRVYRSYGFAPIDTPCLEYLEILTGKGSEETDKQLYRFRDHGNREVGLRFDLTVPFARFAAQHINELGTPFKRYHIGTVWRGERSQAGRYREFMQCDFDTIGTTSIVADIETGLVIYDLMRAIGFNDFAIRVNNRRLLNGLLAKLNLTGSAVAILRALDKLQKEGAEKVIEEMTKNSDANPASAGEILDMASIAGTNDQIIEKLGPVVQGNEIAEQGLDELKQLLQGVRAAGANESNFRIDVSIARGLDYYTGTIFETFLNDLPSIGSVCSGGRYDNLAETYTKQTLPGIGASLGLDRLLAAMESLNLLPKARTPADVMIVYFSEGRINDYLAIAAKLRNAGIGVELYLEAKKMVQQLKYANRKGFQAVLVAGDNEFATGKIQVKWMVSGEQVEVDLDNDCQALIDQLKSNIK
jgi:histidyl-tRNA synthetase